MRKTLLTASSLFVGVAAFISTNVSLAQNNLGSETIRLNQIGFYPEGPKVAIIINNPKATKFSVINALDKKDTAFTGNLKKTGIWKYSAEETSQADFTALKKVGTYVLFVKGSGTSYPFDIKANVGEEIAKASIKGYYFQRASMNLTTEYAGKFARAAGHYDEDVLIHNSAASPNRPKNSKINSSKGWYDAGDYNKYIVNSGITMSTFFSLYEDFSSYANNLKLNIPESNNQLPDLIDEANWNLRWMLTMQDPVDGGVYHKVTNPNFDPVVQPKDAQETRYVVKKSTAASLDFAAVMAHAGRLYKKFSNQTPGLADSCLAASKKAYDWAKKHPKDYYIQKELTNPDIFTGAYDDEHVDDEFLWAASELFVSTGDMNYFKEARLDTALNKNLKVPSWQSVGMLGLYSLIKNKAQFSAINLI